MILDTTFLIDVLRGNDAVEDRERELDERRTAIVTSVSVMELWEGVLRSRATSSERERVAALIEGLHHVAFGREAAMTAAEIAADLADSGELIEVEDVMIGALALEHDQPVLTRNPDQFERIDGLAVETY